jgi:hypothetical protein
MNLLNNIKSMLADGNDGDAVSSKRVVTFLAFVLCAVGFLADLFSDFTITPVIFDSMMYIVIEVLGFTVLEKFAPKDKSPE